ncbi:MAG: DUF4317 domain-containing protein [Lachnospiraceae bacterium]|nr:DUF4317 domain-containing protein [Lachnospiraceae bacterium]
MNKKEISEIKKQFTESRCSISKICGCYVDSEKKIKTTFSQPFLTLDTEEMFKYFELLRKSLSGTIGKNLTTLDFPTESESSGGTQEFLLRLRNSGLNDEDLTQEYFDRIISSYDYVGNYLILLIHDTYDVPGKTTDGLMMEDASDSVYEYILTVICPVNLSKPGLSYDAVDNIFVNRIRDWVVEMPESAILFPSFDDRMANIHSLLYYSKDSNDMHDAFIEEILNCPVPMTQASQKQAFNTIIEETIGDSCDLELMKSIHDHLTQMNEESKEQNEILTFDKEEIKQLLIDSGAEDGLFEMYDQTFEAIADPKSVVYASNITNARSFQVKTPSVVVKVDPMRTDLIETRIIDGRECLVIALDGDVEVNGVTISPASSVEQ